ncbi:MAG: hypothetical protein MK095_03020 [Phycisphaerales bacterium]|nr:hypothetical protein [Phycisphaerales bacterium]
MEDPGRLRRMLLVGEEHRKGMPISIQLTVAGSIAAVLLLGLVFLLDAGRPTTKKIAQSESSDVTELIGPAVLDENAASSGLLDPSIGLDLPSGGWIQIADAQGNLAQQYRCEHLDPKPPELPAHWIDMTHPQVELFLEGGRLLTIEGDQAKVYAPSRALEMGHITGHVRINLYEPRDGDVADPAIHAADMEMRTTSVDFDNFLGMITCEGRIEVQTQTEEIVGRDLEVLMDEQNHRIENMRLQEMDYLLMRPDSQATANAPNPQWPRRDPSFARQPQRSRSQFAPASLQSKPPSADDTADFYRLTLHDNIRIRQGDARVGRTVTGNELHVTFSFQQSSGSDGLVDMSLPADPSPTFFHPPLNDWIIASLLGRSTPTIGPNDILVTCDSGLTMIPAPIEEQLEDPNDTRALLLGSPVYIIDAGDQIEVTCDRVLYDGLGKRYDLLADEGNEVTLHDSRLHAKGTHMWMSPEQGLAGFIDKGTIAMLDEADLASDATGIVPASANAALALEEPADTADPTSSLDITWTEGVDITFDPSGESDDPAIRAIVFKGDVDVVSPDGVFASDWMQMNFTRDAQGKAAPSRLLAREQVRAHNDDQTIWADDLEVTFAMKEDEQQDADDSAPSPTETGSDSLIGAGTEVKDVFANGNVQVLMDDGSRVFAEHLAADAAQEQVVLTGDNVVIARDDFLIDHGRHVELERRNGTAQWKGPGQARMLTQPLDLTADERIERPSIPARKPGGKATVSMRARWNDAMDYDSTFNDGAGSIELRGKVSVVTEPKPTELDRLNGEAMVLQFIHSTEDDAPRSLSEALAANRSDDPFDRSSDRVLEQLIARGDARLEQRTWTTAQRDGVPEVFYVAAKHITWNDLQTSAEVIGDGELVLRQPPSEDKSKPDATGLFKGPGTSRFVWTQRLDMVKTEQGGFDIDMNGDVEGIYKGTTDADTATITAQHVKAVTTPAPTSPAAQSEEVRNGLDLGADLEIERLMAEGGVYISTPRRRVDCNLFDYNLSTGLARLDSAPGRTVSILTEGSPTPVRAGSVLWNMDPAIDTITITNAQGGSISP